MAADLTFAEVSARHDVSRKLVRIVELSAPPDRDKLLRAAYQQVLGPVVPARRVGPLEVTAAAVAERPSTKDVLVALADGTTT
jgi:hypothetical protein